MLKSFKLKYSYWINSVFFTLAQRLSVMLVGIGAFLILVRVLSKEEMGGYALFFTIITIFEVTRDGLIKNTVIRFINISNTEEINEIQSAALLLNIAYTLLFVLIILAISDFLSMYWHAPQLDDMLYIYCITSVISVFFSHIEYIQQANLHFKGIFLIYFVKQGCYFLFIVISLFLKNISLYQLALLQCIAVFIATFFGFIYARKFLLKRFTFSINYIINQWKYGRFVLATNISSQTLRTVDHFMLASLVSTPAVALYNTSVRISNLLDMPSKAVAEALFPKSVQKSTDGKEQVARLYEQTTGSILAVLAPMCLFIFIFPDLIIKIIAGEKYLDAVPILRVAVIYSLLLPFQKQFGTIMDASGKPKINFIVNLILAIYNIIIVYFLVKLLGLIGAAYGLLLTLVLALIINQILLKREFGVKTSSVLTHAMFFYLVVIRFLKKKSINT
ncbi:oligosaccharide flippase family protein [Chondrinema litorale]|uniref:oligosaccharide flippase family protein n=1 Tax=Chondrinema litorale TaxID=2994555 RepID=UPI002543CFAA|nr:oligosaccharide flippase family protein [Chondrinema litorale]UZS00106.1 oligosaccharide flippase family protein [Chondrinema litorale]